MSVHGGPADWWTQGTDAGRKHVATKGIVQSGLVLNLDAGVSDSYPGSGTNWYDLSPIGGSLISYNNPTYINSYFNFDGASDYFQTTRTDLKGGSFAYSNITVELWYQPTSSLGSDPTGNNLITVENSFEISVGNNGNGFSEIQYASNPWAWYGTSASNCITNNKWNLITFVHATVGRWLYVNGVEVFYRGDSGNLTAGTSSYPYLTLMARYTGTGSQCEGNLSIVKIYNRTLTAKEIRQNFNATRGRYGI
jgi:hypothetical protein